MDKKAIKAKWLQYKWWIVAGIAVVIIIVVTCFASEDKKSETISLDFDPNQTPTMVTHDVNTLISDSGYIRYRIDTSLWLMYSEAERPSWRFPDGLYLERFNDTMGVNATFTCDSAVYLTDEKLWEFLGNVRMRNDEGDRFVTQQLFWNQNDHKLMSDSFIHIERTDRIIEGYGFESNENITRYRVHRPSMILPISDFRRHENDSTATVTDSIPEENSANQGVRGNSPRRPLRAVELDQPLRTAK